MLGIVGMYNVGTLNIWWCCWYEHVIILLVLYMLKMLRVLCGVHSRAIAEVKCFDLDRHRMDVA